MLDPKALHPSADGAKETSADADPKYGEPVSDQLAQKLAEQDILRQSIAQAREREAGLMDQLMRLRAEFENFRKRSEAQRGQARLLGREDVLLGILPVCDALQQADQMNAEAMDVRSLKEGVALVRQQLERFLKEQGLHPIRAVSGERLDPHQHEAIAQAVDPALEEGTVVEELQTGYALEGRVVRPARVRVAARPQEEQKKEDTSQEEHHV